MEYDVENVISIVCSRLKQAKGSYEVFKAVLNISQASKACQKYFNAEKLVTISHKYVRERTRFIGSKLKFLTRNNDIDNFLKLADLLVKHFSKLESIRFLNNMVEYVTQHASTAFLKSFLAYFGSRNLHDGSSDTYKNCSNWYSLPHFRPRLFINAMILANKNEWTDKQIVLFDHLLADLKISPTSIDQKIRDAIPQPTKLNFSLLHNYLIGLYSHKYGVYYYQCSFEGLLLEKPEIPPKNGIIPTLPMLRQPIEDQPWFYGNLTELELKPIFEACPTRDCFIVAFSGSRLFYYQSPTRKIPFTETTFRRLPKYGLRNDGEKKNIELYQFYLCLVRQDLEGAKQLQKKHGFDWKKITRQRFFYKNNYETQPHPLFEYLNVVNDIKHEVIEWLFEISPLTSMLFTWDRTHIPDQYFEIVQRVFQHQAFIAANLLQQYMTKAMLDNKQEALTPAVQSIWPYTDRYNVLRFIFEQFGDICRQQKFISQTKMTILLAWKYASGESSGFQSLPKELVQIIVGFVAEPSLLETLVKIVMPQTSKYYISYIIKEAFIQKHPWVLEIMDKRK